MLINHLLDLLKIDQIVVAVDAALNRAERSAVP
jgi:hypothetical protein